MRPLSETWTIADWVRLPTILWVEEMTMSAPQAQGARRQLVGEVQVRAPRLVDDQRQVAIVRDLGQRREVGAGAEIGGGDDQRADGVGRCVERGLQRARA